MGEGVTQGSDLRVLFGGGVPRAFVQWSGDPNEAPNDNTMVGGPNAENCGVDRTGLSRPQPKPSSLCRLLAL